MDHCVICGKLIHFCGKLNARGECLDCWDQRLDDEDDNDSEDADVRIAHIEPFLRYKFD